MKSSIVKTFLFERSDRTYLTLLFALLTLKAIWAFTEISTGYINLNPDEAQYWTWSRNLDFGFYSKPPGIAWQIWLGCKLFGNTELGVRSFSVFISMMSALAIYFTASKSGLSPRTSFWSATVLAFSPIGMMGTFAATTDGGFILFWILALYPTLEALDKKRSANYLLTALFIMCGALFKWPIYLLWIPILLACLFYRPLYNKGIWSGMALSLMGLMPSVIWNSSHNWATFRHTFTQTTTVAAKGNFFDFLGAQFGVLSPIFFILMALGVFEIIKRRKTVSKALLFSALVTTLILSAFLVLSTTKKIQANWALFAYPTAAIIIAWYAIEVLKNGIRTLYYGTALSLLIVFTLLSIPFLQNHPLPLLPKLPYSINPFRHSVGWSELKKALTDIPYQPQDNFLFSDNYQMTSLLSFYGPVQHRQYFFNILNRRQNQFCFWPTMAQEQVGKTGYYVWSKNSPCFMQEVDDEVKRVNEKLSVYFETVELIKIVPLFTANNTIVKGALIFKCSNYNGKEPIEIYTY